MKLFFVAVNFGVANYSVFEGTGVVELILTRETGVSGSITVNLLTVNGTAG